VVRDSTFDTAQQIAFRGRRYIPPLAKPFVVHGSGCGPDHELNKLASNIAQARNIAGLHWRSDTTQAILLGEAVAISILRDQRHTYNETFAGFTFTKFDGDTVTI
jgi:hypothetical protein